MTARYSLRIKGIVQGVGFRPFVYRLAKSFSVKGYVMNTSEGVYAEIEGEEEALSGFVRMLKEHPPVLARIDDIEAERLEVRGDTDFVIASSRNGVKTALISPDIGICDACAAEVMDPGNRRYRYPFTNCTDCGPRFTIIRDIPYDRRNTTMSEFVQCPECQREYNDPTNRRFHAEPNACPACGPKLSFYRNGELIGGDPFLLFDECIKSGGIVAVKGLGGYHLACDAFNEDAVERLRMRKVRYDKPFAVMMDSIETVRENCIVNDEELAMLTGPRKPIVLLQKKEGCRIAPATAPGNRRLGVMLPYTPLHLLIMQTNRVLVMTSANLSDSPMVYDDREAFEKLPGIADAILTHNRQIYRRVDDSVCIFAAGGIRLIRRARGFVPCPVRLAGESPVILALGAQQKNTFCIKKHENAFISSHIGDLDDADTAAFYEREIESFIRLLDAKPEIIACDMHPDYVSTRYAQRYEGSLPVYRIQHHHAHFASVLAEHEVKGDAVGLIFDGTGYGNDGTVWGGEALFGNMGSSRRIGHMLHAPLPGGEAAIREPWRMAMAMIDLACGEEKALEFFERYVRKNCRKVPNDPLILMRAYRRGVNSPLTSSIGRLFDAVSAIAGVRFECSYEGQAAVDLEQAIDTGAAGSYSFELTPNESGMMIFDWRQLIRDVVRDAWSNAGSGVISARFHRAVARLIADAASHAETLYGCRRVVLSGGVFQNSHLLCDSAAQLEAAGFRVLLNEKVPANDGGISYGQAAAASWMCRMS
jgi:[NiFe] hydrogenase maturation protein HypF